MGELGTEVGPELGPEVGPACEGLIEGKRSVERPGMLETEIGV